MTDIDRTKLQSLGRREESRFLAELRRSADLFHRAQKSLLGGVPMSWMTKWAGAFPVFVAKASGANFTDVDVHEYVDPACVDLHTQVFAEGTSDLLT